MHRDIKTENILLSTDLTSRLADLGEARFNDETKTMTMVGTRGFVAPEIIRCERYGEKADVFSFAMVIFECANLGPPARDDPNLPASPAQRNAAIGSGKRPVIPTSFPHPRIRALMTRCWAQDPMQRPSSREVDFALSSLISSGTEFGVPSITEETLVQFVFKIHEAAGPLIARVGETINIEETPELNDMLNVVKDMIDENFGYDPVLSTDPFYDADSENFWKIFFGEDEGRDKGLPFFAFFAAQVLKAMHWRASGSNYRLQTLLAEEDIFYHKEKRQISVRFRYEFDVPSTSLLREI